MGLYGARALVVDKAMDMFMAPRAIALDNEALRILQLAGLDRRDSPFWTVSKRPRLEVRLEDRFQYELESGART